MAKSMKNIIKYKYVVGKEYGTYRTLDVFGVHTKIFTIYVKSRDVWLENVYRMYAIL